MRIQELKEVRDRILSNKSISEEDKEKLLLELDNGKDYGFGTGYSSIDRPWLKYFDLEKYYDLKNDKTVYQDILDMNQGYMDDLAIMYFGGKISYNEMFSKIDQVAKSLKEYGIKKGDFVTVCSAGTPEMIYVFYALAKIGAVANLMAPYFDPKQMSDRINDCESNTLIVMDTFYEQIKDAIAKSNVKNIIVVPALNSSPLRFIPKKKIKLDYSNELWWNQFIKDGRRVVSPESFEYEKDYPLCMVYSSGTTGASKSILLSHDSFQNSVLSYDANCIDISRGQIMYQIIPPWYSTGLNSSIHLPIHKGVTVFQDPRFERNVFVKNIIKHDIDFTIAPTSMYEGFLDEKLIRGKKIKTFSNPFEGGEPLSKEVKESIEQNLRKMGCNSKLRTGYGQCECGAQATSQSQNIDHLDGSVGKPIPGVTISIFDDDFNELTYNQRGNILISTPCGMVEYYNNKQATEDYFYVDNYGRKWSCTGDIGYLDETGDLFIEGRKGDYTEINGNKIYNFDIEKVVNSEEDIKMCDCLGFKNEDEGKDDLVIHIIWNDEYKSIYESDKQRLEKRLREIQERLFEQYNNLDMVPCHFKIRESFPYRPSGKRDVTKMKSEPNDFIYIDKNHLKGKMKLKRM